MTEKTLYQLQLEKNRLQDLYWRLKEVKQMNLYGKNIITDMPRENSDGSFEEKYVEKCEKVERDIRECVKRIVRERKRIEKILNKAPYPERIIIRYRVIYDMDWRDIGKELDMDRTTPSRIFHRYIATLNNTG